MSTEDIKYNGQVFTCRKIIDFSAMIELLSALAKKQDYIEKKLDFQDERINDKDKRLSDLEIKILGISQSKEEKFQSDKAIDKHKETEKEKSKEEEENEEKENEEKEKENEDEEEKLNEDNLNDSDFDAYLKNEKSDEKGDEDQKENKDKDKKEEDEKDDKEKDAEEKDKISNKDEEKKDEEANKEINFKEKTTEKKEDNKENENKSLEKEVKDLNKEISSSGANANNHDEILKKIIKRLKILEAKVGNLEKIESINENKSITINKNSKKISDGRINILNKKIEEFEEDMKKMKEEMSKVKEKVEDFNVYDLFKSDSGDTNVDVCKGLVMALENKVFKKFGFYDIKFKKNDGDIFQNQSEIKNLNALINGIKERETKTIEYIDEMKNNNETKFIDVNKLIKEVKDKIDELDEKINKNNKLNSDEHKELSDKIKEIEQKMQQKKDDIDISKYVKVQGQMNPEDLKLLKELSNRINEVEKTLKITFGKFSPKEVQDRLDNLEAEIAKKSNKYEINEINDRLLFYDENEKDLNFKMDTIEQFNVKARGDMQNIIKKIEFLSGELNRLASDNTDIDKGKGPIIDITKLVDTNLFNEHKKEINKKFDKIRLSFEEIARNLDDILEKLSHTPSDSDFAQFQSIIKNMIEELKLNMSKKFADKNETLKSIKFLETQIKTIQESFTKKMEGADNWLLAKKPLNNYVCASCESIIRGELDKRSEYIPWNRYPNRDEKSYRMGHGFSRMLQMINEDKKKMQEIKEKDNMSDEDKSRGSDSEQNFVVNGSIKLPKLKHKHLNSGKLKMNNLNNEEDNNPPFDTNNPYIDIDPIVSEDRPKIMKIYKRNKQAVQSSYLNRNLQIRNNENLPNLIIKTSPNEKEVQANSIKPETNTQPNEQ